MAEKQLNLGAPLRSARRHPSQMGSKHNRQTRATDEVAKPGSVPFLWELIPGRAKSELSPKEPMNAPRLPHDRRHPSQIGSKHNRQTRATDEVAKPGSVPFLWELIPGRAKSELAPKEPMNAPGPPPSRAWGSLRRFSGEVNVVRQHPKFFSGEIGAVRARDGFVEDAECGFKGAGLVKNEDEDGEGSGMPRGVTVVQSCGFFRWPGKVLRQLNPMPAVKIKTTKALASAGRLVKYASLGSPKLVNAKPVPPSTHHVHKRDPMTKSCELTRIETKPASTQRPMFYSGELNSGKPSSQARNRPSPYRNYKRSVSPRMNEAPRSTFNNDLGYTIVPKSSNRLDSYRSMPSDRAEALSTHLFPPPLPRSPSESWLTRNLSAVSPRKQGLQSRLGASTRLRKQADQAATTTEDTKWETIVKSAHLVYDYGLDSEELVARVPRRARTRK